MDGQTKGEHTPEGVQSKPALPLQPLTESPGGKIDDYVGDIAGRLRGMEMIISNVHEWRFVNGWMNKGGMHSQTSPIQPTLPMQPWMEPRGDEIDGELSKMPLQNRVDVGIFKMGWVDK